MLNQWNIVPPVDPSPELAAVVGGHPLVARLLAQRGHFEPAQALAFLDPSYYTPAPPNALFGVEKAARLLYDALRANRNILVWGDFDVDGQTSTSLLVTGLRRLGGDKLVAFHVPNRFTESHGVRLPMLEEKLANPEFQPDVIVTCDTGITDGAAVALAKDRDLIFIVTDHHDLPTDLQALDPNTEAIDGQAAEIVGSDSVRRADAIINPKLQPPGDPLRTLPGVGVAYKLIQQLFRVAGREGEEQDLLDLVALGIVADVAVQVNDARYLLQLGLDQLRHTRRTGLLALMEVSRIVPEAVDADAIGFQLGPRMNALGRLEDATVAVELLTARDAIRAGQLAGRMERLNQQRRLLTSQISAVAMEVLERSPDLLDFNAIVLAHQAWHAGIVGIVASRLVEEFGKPAVLLLNPPGEVARGSARSVPGIDIGSAIAGCSHLLLTYGGHPGAAGVSLNPDNIDRFRRELDRQIELNRIPEVAPGLTIDAEIALDIVDFPLAEQLLRLAPFGNGNPTPNFLTKKLTIEEDRRFGREGEHRRLMVGAKSGARLPVLLFNGSDIEIPSGPIDLVYTIAVNNYRGERTLQLNYISSRASQADNLLDERARTNAPIQINDMRNLPLGMDQLPTPAHATWYAEGSKIEAMGAQYSPRFSEPTELGRALVLFSAPPASQILRQLQEKHQPTVIYLVGKICNDDSVDAVLCNVAGMCKYALQRYQPLQLDRMAARLGLTIQVIRHCLLWLQAKSQLTLLSWEQDDRVQIGPPGSHDIDASVQNGESNGAETDAALLLAQLTELMAETRAYRRYFLRTRVTALGLSTS